MKINNKLERIVAVFFIYLMVSLTFCVAISVAPVNENTKEKIQNALNDMPSVSAATTGCCTKTNEATPRYCMDNIDESQCDADYFHPGSSCLAAGITDCMIGACKESDAVCSPSKFKIKCEIGGGFFPICNDAGCDINDESLDVCKPACGIFSTDKPVITEWRRYAGQLDKIKTSTGMSYTLLSDADYPGASSSYSACLANSPPRENGYCRTVKGVCSYITKLECDKKSGTYGQTKFFSAPTTQERQACSCENFDQTGCFEGNLYSMNLCGEPKDQIKHCGLTQLCGKNETGDYDCNSITCNIPIVYTSLAYDTSFFKSGMVRVFAETLGTASVQDLGEQGAEKYAGDNFTINAAKSACVQYQGPGEEHYIYICNNDGTVSTLEQQQLTSSRDFICKWNFNVGAAIKVKNDYANCGGCKGGSSIGGGVFSDFLTNIGAEMLTPEWLDYWVLNPGRCNSAGDCDKQGDCQYTSYNDCVPKYAPGSQDLCSDCLTTEASDPWVKCGDSKECYSRGYCSYDNARYDSTTALTICGLDTILGIGLKAGFNELIKQTGLKEDKIKADGKVTTTVETKTTFLSKVKDDFLYVGKQIFTLGGLLDKPYAYIKSTAQSYFADYFGWNANDYKKGQTAVDDGLKALEGAGLKLDANSNIVTTDGKPVTQQADGKWMTTTAVDVTEPIQAYTSANAKLQATRDAVLQNPDSIKKVIQNSKALGVVYNEVDLTDEHTHKPAGTAPITKITYDPKSNQYTAYYTKASGVATSTILSPDKKVTDYIANPSVVTGNYLNSLAQKTTAPAQKTSYATAKYYGAQFYAPLSAQKVQTASGYEQAASDWFKSLFASDSLLLKRAKDMIVGAAWGLGWKVITEKLGSLIFEKTAEEVAKYMTPLSYLNPGFWVKSVFCWLPGSLLLGGYPPCMANPFAVPVISCALQSYIFTGNKVYSCNSVNSWEMPGVSPGYANCYECTADPNRVCTLQRCQALSSDGGCIFANGICSPNPDAVKACDQTSGIQLRITGIFNSTKQEITEAGSKRTIYNISNIDYSATSYDLSINTSKYSECRYSTGKIAFSNMTPITADIQGMKHNATIDISSATATSLNFTYFVQCNDVCISSSFTDLTEIRIEKTEFSDLSPPVILTVTPSPDESFSIPAIQGGAIPGNITNVTMRITTSKAADCFYQRYPLAENFTGEIGNQGELAQKMIEAGSTQDQIEAALKEVLNTKLYPMSHNLPQLIHNVTLKNLNNSQVYAFLVKCNDSYGNWSVDNPIIKFRISDWYDLSITRPLSQDDNPNPEVRVTTDRDANCKYSIGNKNFADMTPFTTTGGTSHSSAIQQELGRRIDFTLFVECVNTQEGDKNVRIENKKFRITDDNTPPQLIRYYYKDGELHISTDEPTKCQYKIDSTWIDMTNNNPYSTEHSSDWPSKQITIKCIDKGKQESTATIKPYETGVSGKYSVKFSASVSS